MHLFLAVKRCSKCKSGDYGWRRCSNILHTEHVLSAMGRPILVGEAGCGMLAKLVNQMIVASTIATVSEGLLLASKAGADPIKLKQALTGGFADSPILQQHGERMLNRDFKPGGTARTQHKDIHTAVSYAKSLELNLPIAQKSVNYLKICLLPETVSLIILV